MHHTQFMDLMLVLSNFDVKQIILKGEILK
jgi:hypothetical protein